MTAKLLCKAAYVPLLVATLLSGLNYGCQKNSNNNPAIDTAGAPFINALVGGSAFHSGTMVNIEDTAHHRFQIYGTLIDAGDTSTLTIYFPDSVFMPITLSFDGVTTILAYSNPGRSEDYYQTSGNSSGTLTISDINTTTYKIIGNFSGTVFKNGSFQDSALTVNNGSFYATYTMP
jgi:hypothetical protein